MVTLRIEMIACLLFAVFFSSSLPAQRGSVFQPNEVLVSDPTLARIADPEFDSELARFCWIDYEGNVWVGGIDRNTGLFDPPDGRAQFVDADALGVRDLGNGCEWVYTDRGAEIVYTKTDYSFPSARFLARAIQVGGEVDGHGVWIGGIMDEASDRWAPIGSLDLYDTTPTIAYAGRELFGDDNARNSVRALFVRQLADETTEQMVPTTDEFSTPGARWIPNSESVIFTRPMPVGTVPSRQVFQYDMNSQALEQLTSDAGDKWSAFMWQAPEFRGDYVMMALIDETHLGLYRKFGKKWRLIHTIDPPAGNPPGSATYIWSPEPFVYNGKSYIVMTNSPSDDQQSFEIPTEIWLANINPRNQWYRRLSDDREVVRKDPEAYISQQGPYIYINSQGGVYRLDTGLGPQSQ